MMQNKKPRNISKCFLRLCVALVVIIFIITCSLFCSTRLFSMNTLFTTAGLSFESEVS